MKKLKLGDMFYVSDICSLKSKPNAQANELPERGVIVHNMLPGEYSVSEEYDDLTINSITLTHSDYLDGTLTYSNMEKQDGILSDMNIKYLVDDGSIVFGDYRDAYTIYDISSSIDVQPFFDNLYKSTLQRVKNPKYISKAELLRSAGMYMPEYWEEYALTGNKDLNPEDFYDMDKKEKSMNELIDKVLNVINSIDSERKYALDGDELRYAQKMEQEAIAYYADTRLESSRFKYLMKRGVANPFKGDINLLVSSTAYGDGEYEVKLAIVDNKVVSIFLNLE